MKNKYLLIVISIFFSIQLSYSQSWLTTGNAGTTSSNFLGTTDNKDLFFKRNNTRAGIISVFNTALGVNTYNTTSLGVLNTALGISSMQNNGSGSNNNATGYRTLYNNINGDNNSAYGHNSLTSNTNGYFNSAYGSNTLSANTTGFYNSAFGAYALKSCTGTYNTGIGSDALNTTTTGTNNIGVGFNAIVPSASGSNQIRIGNTSITYAGIQVAWSITSDSRWKTDIKNSELGLNFITKLNPVSYLRTNDVNQKIEFGFIAQEIEQNLTDLNINNAGFITIDDYGMYSLRYNDFIAPMVKSIQELNSKYESQNEKINILEIQTTEQKNQIEELNNKLQYLEEVINDYIATNPEGITTNITNHNDVPSLKQNTPNPFLLNTAINYYLPSSTYNALIIVTDAKGNDIKMFNNLNKGEGSILFSSNELIGGVYKYSLWVDDKLIDSKQMLLIK